MNPKRIFAIFLRQLFLLKRGSRLINIFYWSSIDLILWGFITVYLNSVGGSSLNFMTVMLGAVILWNFLFRVQYGVTVSFLEDSWARNFMNLFSSPLSTSEYVSGLILTSIFNGLASLVTAVIIARLIFSYSIFQLGIAVLPFIVILFIFGWAIGLFATAVVMRLGPSAEVFAWSFPALFTPFSSVFYPIYALPQALQPIANALPTAHVFEGMRSVILAGSFDSSRLFLALGLALFYFVLSYAFLLWSYRAVLRKGLFTRFYTD